MRPRLLSVRDFGSCMIADLDRFTEALTLAQRDARLRPLERRLHQALRGAFLQQGANFLRRFRALRPLYEAAGDDDWGPLFNGAVDDTAEVFRGPLIKSAEQALAVGWTQAAAELAPALDLSFQLTNPRIAEYLRLAGADRVAGINATTKAGMRTILSQAAEEGWTYRRTAAAITKRYQEYAGPPLRGGPKLYRSRAELIAVTEVADASEAASLAVAQELAERGHVIEKSWLLSSQPCPVCRSNGGTGWIAIDKAFPSGHQRVPGHPGCKCATQTRLKTTTGRSR